MMQSTLYDWVILFTLSLAWQDIWPSSRRDGVLQKGRICWRGGPSQHPSKYRKLDNTTVLTSSLIPAARCWGSTPSQASSRRCSPSWRQWGCTRSSAHNRPFLGGGRVTLTTRYSDSVTHKASSGDPWSPTASICSPLPEAVKVLCLESF